jgi:hypothetical protein
MKISGLGDFVPETLLGVHFTVQLTSEVPVS